MRIFDFSKNIRGVGVVVRASLNAPIENGKVTDVYRVKTAIPTLEALSRAGARTTVIGHIGRDATNSMRPVFDEVKKHTNIPLQFIDGVVGSAVCQKVEALQAGEVLFLENVRREVGEKTNDPVFAEKLASYGSIFINDAFDVAHREHASVVGIPEFIPGFAGPLFMHEYERIQEAQTPKGNSLAIVGGAKFLTKEPLIRKLLETYSHVFVGGALAHDFYLAKGLEIGKSVASRSVDVSDLLDNERLLLPTDAVVLGNNGVEIKLIEEILESDFIYDVGPGSIAFLAPYIEQADFVLWNGPMGNFEKGYSENTEALAHAVAKTKGESIVGGGDTIAAIEKLNLNDKFTHVSTAGGAMLQFIADGTLPGIKALG